MGECYFPGCDRDHPWTPGYPGGCPFEGRPGRVRAPIEEPISVEEVLRYQQRDAQFQRQAEAEARRLEFAKLKIQLASALEPSREERASARPHAQAEGKRIVEGVLAAAYFQGRDRLRPRRAEGR
jgi:hypothetical protein